MIRILGENGDNVSPPPPSSTDGATPEEITAAISELAGETASSPVQKSVWPQHEDLPLPPEMDAPEQAVIDDGELLAPITESAVIDDLESVEISPESITRAVEMNQAFEIESQRGSFLAALPFGILALIGSALGGYGIASQFGLIQSGRTVETAATIYMPPFLIVLGGSLFLVMAYYFIRTLTIDD